MAKPIKETPVLTGRDAKKFLENIKNPIKASDAEKARIKKNYEFMKSISTFQ